MGNLLESEYGFVDALLPETLLPRQVEFQIDKVQINILPNDGRGLELVCKAKGYQGNLDGKLLYAMRNIVVDDSGRVFYDLMTTDREQYERYRTIDNVEGLNGLEKAAPVGGCVILLTTEKDGSQKMIVQNRTVNKAEYARTPGASTGGLVDVGYDEKGNILPIEDQYRKHIEQKMMEEVGLTSNQFDLKVTGIITELKPKTHHEISSIAITSLSYEEVCEAYALRVGEGKRPKHLIGVPADPETIAVLVSVVDCPIPPSHVGAYIAAGYMMILEKDGVESAKAWVKSLENRVEENYEEIDSIVRGSNTGLQSYSPDIFPQDQGLEDVSSELLHYGVIIAKKSGREIRLGMERVEPGTVCVTGSLHFPKYSTDTSEYARAKLAADTIKNYLMDGYNMAIVVSPVTPQDYLEYLENMAKFIGRGKLRLIPETGKTYSGARRQAVEVAEKDKPVYVMTCEIEKKELEKYLQALLQPFKKDENKPGIVVMDRGISKSNPNLPSAQDEGELMQNNIIMRNLVNAGVFPKGTPSLDLLNGTRIVLNESLNTNIGLKINPVDLLKLTYVYDNPEFDPGVSMKIKSSLSYPVDHYSAAVYHLIVMAAELGIGVVQVRVPYVHDESQRKLEDEGPYRETFEKKRQAQARAIMDQNFDLIANICVWKKEGIWPQVLLDALGQHTPIVLKHFSSLEYSIIDGELIKKPDLVA